MLVTSFTSKSGNAINIASPYTIVCNGVKTSNFAKKNRVRLCENMEQKMLLQGGVKIDKKPNGFIKRIKASKV
jgi:hypothetical protein